MKSIILFIVSVLLAPFFSAVILKVKAFFAGKKGPSLLINYYTLLKLFRKGSVYSSSTTFIFRLGPVIALCTTFIALLFMPFAGLPSVLSFNGDIIVLLYLMGLGRFFTIIAALDTASSFEGMGTSREAYFSALAEATIFMILIMFYGLTGELSLSSYFTGEKGINLWSAYGSSLLLATVSLFLVLLTENSRVPVDDPATHLELTMIHEVMVLDHSGPDLAFIHLNSYLKLLFYASFITLLIYPHYLQNTFISIVIFYLILSVVYIVVGITESVMARFKMNKVPKFILTSFALVFFATILIMEFIK
ncbi:hydrogenase [Deferribacter autotrophicus]|uniref:Hydrogenase n=1 Tax=Deferribacter autotrophicus TaxID=500465 RepID=A0A5A8F457_9BACT|nr:NADH-quinone oxidoreductase subunit H [Deferribacter autotrophicus]KAA0258241.1 hydrogenase [Deferribacter autotrophicus]